MNLTSRIRPRLAALSHCLITVLFMVLTASQCSAKAWRSIVPLHSSRVDVQRLLGTPLRSGKYTSSYELPAEIVQFMYAKGGACGSTIIDSWRVPRDTVVNIHVVPRTNTLFQSNTSFIRVQDRQQSNIFHYSDNETGIRYTVENRTGSEYVLAIDYLPAAADHNLRCAASQSTQTASIPIFQQYGLISPDSEKAILDNFAIQLLNDQDLTGYVVLRRGQHTSRVVARKLRYIRNYLYKVRRMPSERLFTLEGKPKPDFTVELYLVPKGKSGPI